MNIGFLLLPEFTLLSYASAIEPLRNAQYVRKDLPITFSTLSLDGAPVQASCGVEITPNKKLEHLSSYTHLFLCGGMHIEKHTSSRIVQEVRSLSKNYSLTLGAIDTATYILAKAGLLANKRCTIHWENMASLREHYPHLVLSNALYEMDERIITCGGGVAPLDMMLKLLSQHYDTEVSNLVSEQFAIDRVRNSSDKQRVPLKSRLGTSQPKLVEAVMLMEANLEEPMSPDEIAQAVNLSRRQLERLFQKYLKVVPTRYYLSLRLYRARQLLLQTSMSIVEVAFACGFVSAPHFSKCYRDFFGLPPRDERRMSQEILITKPDQPDITTLENIEAFTDTADQSPE